MTSARVNGKPRITDQRYVGTSEEVLARLSGASQGTPERTQRKAFGDVAAVWGVLERLRVVDAINEACGPRRSDAGASVGTYLPGVGHVEPGRRTVLEAGLHRLVEDHGRPAVRESANQGPGLSTVLGRDGHPR